MERETGVGHGGKTPCYVNTQVGIIAVNSGDTIKLTRGIYSEPFVLDSDKQLTVQGGWDAGFTSQTAGTTAIRAPKVTKGVMTFQELRITGTRYGGCTCRGTMIGTRWCDNGDGTVTDLIGYDGKGECLVWLKKADWGGTKPWRNDSTDCDSPTYTCYDDAHQRAGLLYAGATDADLSDGSVEGDWRLPTKTELSGLANGTEAVRDS